MRSEWRPGDSVAYEELRSALDEVVARDLGGDMSGADLKEAAALRRLVLAVDGFDRDAVDALRAQVNGEHEAAKQVRA